MEKYTLSVSVVAANYNNGDFLHDFFSAWLLCAAMPSELIFVDDGSLDDSLEIARHYQAKIPGLVIVELGKNIGFGNALNAGIALATGKYIMRIDPDDVVIPGRLEKQYAVLESGNVDVVGSNAIIFRSGGGREVGYTNFPVSHDDIAATIFRGEHGVLHPTVMARAELFKKNSYVQGNVPAEDYDIFARMLCSGARFANIPEPLLRYRVHQKSASNILPFSTISKTYALRDSLFEGRTSRASVVLYYLHIKFYRKHLFSLSPAGRLINLAFASLLRPQKAMKRIARVLNGRV